MKIHEHQAKEILSRFQTPVPFGIVAFSVEEAERAAAKIFETKRCERVAVKAQIHAGGRGKGGGVKVVTSQKEALAAAGSMLGKPLVTRQTGPEGRVVKRILVEQGLQIERELYLGLLVDRERRSVCVIGCAEGGMEIEEVAREHPERIIKEWFMPGEGLTEKKAEGVVRRLKLEGEVARKTERFLGTLGEAFIKEDCSLLEINPFVVDRSGEVWALDAKMVLDDNASFRHPEWEQLKDPDEENPVEEEARKLGISYIKLDGQIGCLVNGAGLAMATMDIIKHYGSEPANFLDVGGGATTEQVTHAFRMILTDPNVKAIFVNIFGGIMRCDVVAEGVTKAAREVGLKVPLVVRLEGTRVDEGRKILSESGINLRTAKDMDEGARMVVELASAARH